ncbi:hypothetical protein Hypma_013998 [Hypsizygus marmoreus]|uniref:PH domain-containing protein n=1 Tax=Hypsizygus marmoreus TaxID=39966 RepID=A0A369KAM9_HYPMA|nr:hypothetical protein Hypma_013998 [Hypsizygus marmoreus]
MEQHRPRSQSVLQIRSSLPSRTSKLLQKVSNFRGRLRFNKAKDDRDIHNPYPSQTHQHGDDEFGGGGGVVKPYMSQPLLGLGGMLVEPFNPEYRDGEDSCHSQSTSPSGSEDNRRHVGDSAARSRSPGPGAITVSPRAGRESGVAVDGLPPVASEVRWESSPHHQHSQTRASPTTLGLLDAQRPRSSSPSLRSRSSFDDRPRISSGAVTEVRRDGVDSGVASHHAEGLPLPGSIAGVNNDATTPPPPPPKHQAAPSIVISSHPPEMSPSSPLRNSLDDRPRPPSIELTEPKIDGSSKINTRLSATRIFTRKQSRTRLKDAISPLHEGPSPSFPASTPHSRSRTPSPPPPLPALLASITYSNISAHTTSLPALSPPAATRTVPPRRETAPRLAIASHRFSLTLQDGSNARLSPSVILRPPPLPILNLPTLPTIRPPDSHAPSVSGAGEAGGLRSMPELPHVGGEVGDDGDGEVEGDDDGEDEDEDEEADGDRDTTREGASSLDLLEDGSSHRPSMSSSTDHPGLQLQLQLHPYTSHGKTHSRSSSYQGGQFPSLPSPDTSRIDLSFLEERPPSPPAHDRKGKGRARDPSQSQAQEEDTSRTPTSVSPSPYRDYFSRPHGSGSGSQHANVNGNEGAVHVHPRNDSMGPRTPRAEEGFLPPIPLQNVPVVMGIGMGKQVLMQEKRPGIYKHASRSLIDIHAVEKKERVERMVRAEEEVAEELERFKRRQSGVGAMGKRRQQQAERADADAELVPATPVVVDEDINSLNNKRVSKAPPYETVAHALRRRRSMPTFISSSEPPPYPSFHPHAQPHPMSENVKIQPRDDEGRERLPPYSNAIYMRSILPRKMEFLAPGEQAKDRKWRRVICVLEGTAFKVFRCPAGTTGVSALGEWWEKKVGVGDVSANTPSAPGTASGSGSGGTAAAGAAEGERERLPKLGEETGTGQTELVISTPSAAGPSTSPDPVQQLQQPPQMPPHPTRSRLNLAVNLLRPSRPHGRSNSDVPNPPPKPRSPRSSLNILGAGSSPGRESTGSRPRSSFSSQHSMAAPSSSMSTSASDQSMTLSVPSPSSSSHSSRPNTASSFRGARISPAGDLDPDPADLIRAYTMQNAESGLGNDYIKRKNVIRVRVEGEQFLIQAKDVAEVVAWIEALQASANVALDLDERPMPKGPLFPRRRRRRQRPRPATDSVSHPAEDTNDMATAGVGASTHGPTS